MSRNFFDDFRHDLTQNQVRAAEAMIDWDDRVTVTWHANSPVALLS